MSSIRLRIETKAVRISFIDAVYLSRWNVDARLCCFPSIRAGRSSTGLRFLHLGFLFFNAWKDSQEGDAA